MGTSDKNSEATRIYSAAFREFFGMNQNTPVGENPPVFLGINGKDPAKDLLDALREGCRAKVIIQPYSASRLGDQHNVIDEQGKPALNMDFGSVRRTAENMASVEFGYYGHPTYSGSGIYILELKDGDWRVIEKRKGLIT
jgi:hypothetical protein